jgi:hypothetical protein
MDLTGHFTARLDLDLAVGDLAVHLAGGADEQALADGERPFVAARDLGALDLRRAFEMPGFGDLDRAGLGERRLDSPFEDVIWPESTISRPTISFLLSVGASLLLPAALGVRSRLQVTPARPITGAVGLANGAAPPVAGAGLIGIGRAPPIAAIGFAAVLSTTVTVDSSEAGVTDSGFMSSPSSFLRRNMLVTLLYGRRDSLTRP